MTLILSASPNMMHFVRAFSIMRAYGVRLIAIEEAQNYGEIVAYTPKTFLKMAGGRRHTPHHSSLDLPLAIIYRNHQKSLAYFVGRVWHIRRQRGVVVVGSVA